jgi:hypothetical protein
MFPNLNFLKILQKFCYPEYQKMKIVLISWIAKSKLFSIMDKCSQTQKLFKRSAILDSKSFAILESKSFAILESKSFAILLNLLSRIPKIANCFVLLYYKSVAIPHFFLAIASAIRPVCMGKD